MWNFPALYNDVYYYVKIFWGGGALGGGGRGGLYDFVASIFQFKSSEARVIGKLLRGKLHFQIILTQNQLLVETNTPSLTSREMMPTRRN